ncbi:methylglyoxal synthase [Flavobacterium sp. 316]|uniref:Methylglyoxal synthase n=1 Tax=Flavobacterium sediminilitoris TaxID=2024526 RepID=A0ABY4HJK5_9FLAO|nr:MULTISPECIES: methylglyoxal synthase [Flavobacterium]KIX20378.1 methylglyoxal synthase [Flavobacterium sp. 316]UOX32868.1 methylglyoxal synthase [Flavobacterium sediminilitoris]
MGKQFEIAVIAHDGKKADMVQFLNKNKNILLAENIKLIATGTTGGRVESVGIKVKKMLSGPLGGDAQIAARVAEGKTKMVLFFKDPNSSHAHEPDISMLIRICDVHNIPLATNEATAQLLLLGLDEIKNR